MGNSLYKIMDNFPFIEYYDYELYPNINNKIEDNQKQSGRNRRCRTANIICKLLG